MRILKLAVLCAALGGCASATRGTTENISLNSSPPGAEATVSGLDNPMTCVTPCVVVVKRNADISVAFAKDGFEPAVVPLSREVVGTGAAGFAGNLIVGGVIGMGVDAVTGAATDHHPNPVVVTLQPMAQPAPPPPPMRRKPTKQIARKPAAGT
ncbi:MAG: translation initiation factor 2 [Rhodopseudomonas sp.]|uniref:translation initiation factor 2 n=1 Tax=Rhodopseudomonas sp. TaxID=1078 RepID=UPI001821AAA4|nr:translation initiation factor 2 [Rhodopseudomonas sp.]NVN88590.1 translation initiation factor 2 [Rhodopseudomonas sp.]